MNLQEAQNIINKLGMYKGQTMQPFNAPVNDFLILPAEQNEFTQMLKDMTDNDRSFKQAIEPYSEKVTILVCSDSLVAMDKLNHCSLDYFLQSNAISL